MDHGSSATLSTILQILTLLISLAGAIGVLVVNGAALAGASDAELMKPWSLLANGTILFTLPKVVVLRSFVMNHLIHHRAQLGVYLRLNDIPVPSLYGPSADEAPSA